MKKTVFAIVAIILACGSYLVSWRNTQASSRVSFVDQAFACRNCPFPLRIGKERWLTRDGKIEFELVETYLKDGRKEAVMYLANAQYGYEFAGGYTVIDGAKDSYSIQLYDSDGGSILAYIEWHDRKKGDLTVRFICNGCRHQNLF